MSPASQPLRVLHVEDSEQDVELAMLQLRRSGFTATATRVEDAAAMREALGSRTWDLVLSDCSMPRFSAVDALALLHEQAIEVPFIIVSGTIAEETAAAAMRAGAHDFIRKDQLAGLGPAVERELRRQRAREEQKQVEGELRASEARYRAAFRACPAPLWAYDPDTHDVHDVNDAALSEHGYSRDELATMSMRDLLPVEGPRSARVSRTHTIEWNRMRARTKTGSEPELDVATRLVEIGDRRIAIAVGIAPGKGASIEDRSSLASTDVLELASRAALASAGPEGAITRSSEMQFEKALERLWIAFQPIVSWTQRTLFGYEAFARSDEPGLTTAFELVAAAERLGRLNDLGRAIRERVARSVAMAPVGCKLFVHVGSDDFGDAELFSPWAPLTTVASSVVLEITERSSLEWVEDLGARLRKLRRLGFQIAVSEMGASWTGLAAFSPLEPEMVKLDMSLVRGVDTSARRRSVMRSMLELAGRDLGMIVICEGVQTPGERDTLAALGADLQQGDLFARPSREFVTPTF
jgi:PAS domain S-box-containing protein